MCQKAAWFPQGVDDGSGPMSQGHHNQRLRGLEGPGGASLRSWSWEQIFGGRSTWRCGTKCPCCSLGKPAQQLQETSDLKLSLTHINFYFFYSNYFCSSNKMQMNYLKVMHWDFEGCILDSVSHSRDTMEKTFPILVSDVFIKYLEMTCLVHWCNINNIMLENLNKEQCIKYIYS